MNMVELLRNLVIAEGQLWYVDGGDKPAWDAAFDARTEALYAAEDAFCDVDGDGDGEKWARFSDDEAEATRFIQVLLTLNCADNVFSYAHEQGLPLQEPCGASIDSKVLAGMMFTARQAALSLAEEFLETVPPTPKLALVD